MDVVSFLCKRTKQLFCLGCFQEIFNYSNSLMSLSLAQECQRHQPRLFYSGYRISYPGVKLQERGFYHIPLSSTEVKEAVEPYFYLSPSGPSGLVLG
jgi:hypothetical protein